MIAGSFGSVLLASSIATGEGSSSSPQFEQVLLVATVLLGVAFLRAARRFEAGQRGYVIVVGAVFGAAVLGLVGQRSFLGFVALGFGALVVLMPWVFEQLARIAFGRGRLGLAVRFAAARAFLMPGSGLSRQQEILRGLALLEAQGVDRALEHFRGLASDTDDGGELALINEQIVSMLFYGQRWEEGIAHYEARFHPQYAAMRPALALGLLRAYGESGRLERAAGLLRALEDGPVGTDPRASGVLSQARLTFLAYAGAASPVSEALDDEGRRALGLSPASSALFRGIAFARAGESSRAQAEFETVSSLAAPTDDRVVEASRNALAKLDGYGDLELGPELERYAVAVADRLRAFLRAAPRVRRGGRTVATPIMIVGMLGVYAATLMIDRGGVGLLDVGAATPELLRAGQWGRLFTGVWVHADPVSLLVDLYALWLAGPLLERLYGSGRVFVVAVVGAGLGLAAATSIVVEPQLVLAGGTLVATTLVAGGLWTMSPVRTPGLPARARRALLIPLVLMALALVVSLHRGLVSLEVPLVGIGASAFVGAAGLGVLPPSRSLVRVWRALALVLGVAGLAAAAQVWSSDAERFLLARRHAVHVEGVALDVPRGFEAQAATDAPGIAAPILDGIVDGVALRTGDLVEFVVLPPGPTAEGGRLVASEARLQRTVSVAATAPDLAFTQAYEAAGGASTELTAFVLRQNGEPIASVVERELGSGHTVCIFASPPDALAHAPSLYAAILASAR